MQGLTTSMFDAPRNLNVHATLDVGNGHLVAHAPGFGFTIAVWEDPNGTPTPFRPGGTETHISHRVFFAIHNYHEAGAWTDISENGMEMVARAVQFTMQGSLGPQPPRIIDLLPAPRTIHHPAANGITFTVTNTEAIPPEGISMVVNGTDVSSALTITGDELARNVSYDGLDENVIYTAQITVANTLGSTSRTLTFDTFSPDLVLIEAEDYNFTDQSECQISGVPEPPPAGGGQFIDNPIPSDFEDVPVNQGPNSYVDNVGVPNVDFSDTMATGGVLANNAYRFCDPVGTQPTSDFRRQKHIDENVRDFHLHQMQPNEWLNYSRTFPDDTYRVYLRASATAAQTVQLDSVSNPTSASQTTSILGSFVIPSGGGFDYIPLTDLAGNPRFVPLSGVETVRLTALGANNNLNINFLIFVPAEATSLPPSVISVLPPDGSTTADPATSIEVELQDGSSPVTTAGIQLFFDGTDVTASATITDTASGAHVSFTPSTPLESLSSHTARIEFNDAAGDGPYSFEWSFQVRFHVDPGTLIINQVVETGGDGPVEAKWTGQVFDHPNLGPGFTVQYFAEDVPAFTDRVHQWNGATAALPLPPYLVGGEYIMIRNDNRDNLPFQLDVTLNQDALVYILIDNRHGEPASPNTTPPDFTPNTAWILDDGWQPVTTGYNRTGDPSQPDEVGVDEGGDGTGPGASINQFSSIYVREVPAGTVSLFSADNAGRNMYGVVVTEITTFPPTVTHSPPADALNVWLNTPIEINLVDGTDQIVPGSIVLEFDGLDVTSMADIQDTAEGVRVTYQPDLIAGNTHTVRVEFADNAAPPNAGFEEWSFTVATFALPEEPFTGTVFMVTDRADLEQEGTQNLAGYLRLLGYTVEVTPSPGNASSFRGTLTPEQIDQLEASDLVLVHRATSSGSFSGDAIPQWNNLNVPLLLGSAFLARDPNWSWSSGIQAAVNQSGLTLEDPGHPIVAGLADDLYIRPIDINRLDNLDVGNGQLIASADGGVAIAAWEGSGLFRDEGVQTHTQRRVFFPIMRYHEMAAPGDAAGSFSEYSDNGLRLIANAVEYTLSGQVTWSPPVVVPELVILNPALADTTFTVSVESEIGKFYTLQYKDTLEAPLWNSLPAVPGTGDTRTLTDPSATTSTRFYRVVE
ncbi:MAG TPA: Ig-like domain-containing protein [Methylomirabilota bacterium]|nr:Ig-like domain-containing protein [Methylomirabilota bacterium]